MELEVTKKVRLAIKAKLLELGVHVDEELPDYIMILIANRRTKVQMEDDLSLFLGDNTLKFTSWLFQVLKKLEEVTANPTTVATLASQKSTEEATTSKTTTPPTTQVKTSEVPQQQSSPVSTTINKEPMKAIVIKSRPNIIPTSEKAFENVTSSSVAVKRRTQKISVSSGIKSPVLKKAKASYKSEKSPSSLQGRKARSDKSSSSSPEKSHSSGGNKEKSITTTETLIPSQKLKQKEDYNSTTKTKITSSPRKLIRSKSPIIAPTHSISSKYGRSRSPILTHHSKGSSQVGETKRLSTINRDAIRSPKVESSSSLRSLVVHKTNSKDSKSRSRSPLANARKSLKSLVAVVKRHNEINAAKDHKDEEYNPSRPAVTSTAKGISSVVHVTERPKRATKQQERGSNNLLVRALADAQKSIVSHSMQPSSGSGKTTDEKEVKDSSSYDDDDKPNVTARRRNSEDEVDGRRQERRKRKEEIVDNKKVSIKDRLGYRIDKSSRLETEGLRRRHYDVNDLDDLETDELDEEFTQGVDGDFKIRINVATSKKERNVTLEKFDDSSRKPQPSIQSEISVEEPKRLSIQLNVDSESSSSSSSDEDELEIQPRPTEDTNFELSTSSVPKEKSEEGQEEQEEDVKYSKNENIKQTPSVSSNSENYSEGEETKENKRVKEDKSQQRSSSESSRTKQHEKSHEQTDDDDDDEEEMEEYEIEEEEEEEEEDEEDEEEAFRKLREEYTKRKQVMVHEMELQVEEDDDYLSNREQEANSLMETSEKEMLYLTNSPGTSFDMDTEGGMDSSLNNYPRYGRVHAKPLNHSDTKFVVTMDSSDSLLYDEMETDQYSRYSTESMDLRRKISRTVVQSKPSVSINQNHHNFSTVTSTPLTSSLYNASSRAYLPITGAPLRPPTVAPGGTAPVCKYWPECTFKDKCVYPHPKCKYGQSCTKPNCPFKHDTAFVNNTGHGDVSTKGPNSSSVVNENDGKIQCKFFPKCHSMSCTFYHPSPCRFGVGCTNAKCKSYHPGQTVGQHRSQMSAFGSSSRTGSRVVPPAAHLLRWKAPSTLESANSKDTASSSTAVDSSISASAT